MLSATQQGREAVLALFEEIESGLSSEHVREKRREGKEAKDQLKSDARRLGGIGSGSTPLQRRKKAKERKAKIDDIKVEYTPTRKLVYDPTNVYQPYTKAAERVPSCILDWKRQVNQTLVHSQTVQNVSGQTVSESENTRKEVRTESHEQYLNTTANLMQKISDTNHAETTLNQLLGVTESALESCDEVTLRTPHPN